MRIQKRVFVFGIDGGSWRVLDPLMEKGCLPNLSALVKKGRRGILRSSLPHETVPAWIDFATGANSAVHGCYSFWKQAKQPGQFSVIDADDIEVKTFYEILEKHGLKCILVNLPSSYPFRLKKGIIVSSFLNPNDDQLFYPSSLGEEIPELSNYRPFPDDFNLFASDDQSFQVFEEIEKNRWLVGKKLFKKNWDFFFYLFSASDWVQHNGLSLFTQKPKEAEVEIFRLMDRYLGWFLTRLRKEDLALIISDHGFKVCQGTFYLNAWLKKKGYLEVEKKWFLFNHQGFPKEKIELLLRRRKLRDPIIRFAARSFLMFPPLLALCREIVRGIPSLFSKYIDGGWGEIGIEVEPTKTRALNYGDMLVHLWPKRRADYQHLRDELIGELRKLKEPGKNKKLFKGVYKSEEVWGRFDSSLPGIVLELDNWSIRRPILSGRLFDKNPRAWHDQEGIIVARGVDAIPEKIELCDLASSILGFFDIKPI